MVVPWSLPSMVVVVGERNKIAVKNRDGPDLDPAAADVSQEVGPGRIRCGLHTVRPYYLPTLVPRDSVP